MDSGRPEIVRRPCREGSFQKSGETWETRALPLWIQTSKIISAGPGFLRSTMEDFGHCQLLRHHHALASSARLRSNCPAPPPCRFRVWHETHPAVLRSVSLSVRNNMMQSTFVC